MFQEEPVSRDLEVFVRIHCIHKALTETLPRQYESKNKQISIVIESSTVKAIFRCLSRLRNKTPKHIGSKVSYECTETFLSGAHGLQRETAALHHDGRRGERDAHTVVWAGKKVPLRKSPVLLKSRDNYVYSEMEWFSVCEGGDIKL